MEISEENVDGIVVLSPRGHIDSTNSEGFGQKVVALLQPAGARLVIDLSGVEYMSSGGFRALLIVFKQARAMGRGCLLCRVEGKVLELFKVGRFLDLFPIKATREDALAALR